ncbi:hypothetical protein PA598K_02619 [Paenibacillus sp. 598K]|uniref:YfbM family protein n=1 Tax=Paenibacillus sp. 598K TaxID=1117987 RepID=UPI000FFADCEB|nr:YfbM family protein [Paenibacillus sp. 598K]GBF74283.1 hypothetical protein PA598K_02619 [Paenibacillus sp. 598K]
MGMIGIYVAISEEEARQLADGQLLPDDMELYERDDQLDIDKSWQAISFVLTGELAGGSPPLSYAVPTIGELLLDYGDYGAFYLLPAQLAEAAQALSEISEEEFHNLYVQHSPIEHQIYPVTEGEDPKELLDYLEHHFTALVAYYRRAAERGQGMLFYIA